MKRWRSGVTDAATAANSRATSAAERTRGTGGAGGACEGGPEAEADVESLAELEVLGTAVSAGPELSDVAHARDDGTFPPPI